MADVTRNNGEWDVEIARNEEISLATAGTYIDGNINVKGIAAIQTKVFDDVWAAPLGKTTAEAKAINSGASGIQDGSTFAGQYMIYFGKIRNLGINKTNTTTANQTWDAPWHIRMRVTAKMFYRDANGNKIYHNDGKAQYDWQIYGNGTTYTWSNFNNKYNWTPTYYHFINRPKATYMKSINDSPVLWGIHFLGTNSTFSNRSYYKREFTIEVLECDNCEIEFLDDWQCVRNYHLADSTMFPVGTAKNYYGYCKNNGSYTSVDVYGFTNYNAADNGLRESGDENTTEGFYYYTPVKAGGQGIHGYSIIGQLEDGTFASFTTNNVLSSATVTKNINTTDKFLYGGQTLYYISNNDFSAGSNTSIAARYGYYALDTRYVSNYYGTSASTSPTYAFGYSGSGTSAAYSNAWIKVEFTEDKKKYKVKSLLLNDRDRAALGEGYYMHIGASYNSIEEYYRIATIEDPLIYYIDENGKISLPDFLSKVATSGSYNDLINKPTSLPANGGTAANVSGTVAIANGGTGATTAAAARTNLGLDGAATKAVDTSIAAASKSANLPTSAAVASFVEGKGYKTTDNNTTYTFAEGNTNGAFTVTPSGGTAQSVRVHGVITDISGKMDKSNPTGTGSIAVGEAVSAGTNSAAFGYIGDVSGSCSFSAGAHCTVKGTCSTALGEYCVAESNNQTIIGKWNVSNTTSSFIIGNGITNLRRNALEIGFDGNISKPVQNTGTTDDDTFKFYSGLGYKFTTRHNNATDDAATKTLCFDDLGQFYTKEVSSDGTYTNSHIGSIGTSDSPWKNAFIDDICITDGIRYKDNTSGRTPIILRGFDGDSSGSGVMLGNDGCLIIGSGESPTNLKSNLNLTGASENTYISSDNSIYFYSNCNTIADKVGLEMNGTALMPVVNDTFHLGNTTHKFGWVFCGSVRPGNVALNWDTPSKTADPAIYFRKGSNAEKYYTKIVPSNVSANRTITIPNAGGTLAIASSDIRLKDNIKDTEVENAMETINQIKLHSFDWNDGSHPHQKIGFIADELEEIDDRLAEGEGGYFEDGSMNVKTVDMFYMLGYIVKGMQELDKENKILKEKIEKLENK